MLGRLKGRTSEWVHPGPDGKLAYKTTPAGDRIMDFSYAGYMGGGVALPEVPVKITVKPVEGDSTAAIQEAIDKVSALSLENGLSRGGPAGPGGLYLLGDGLASDWRRRAARQWQRGGWIDDQNGRWPSRRYRDRRRQGPENR